MILSDGTLTAMLQQGLIIRNPVYANVNPASIDIRVGNNLIYETLAGRNALSLLNDVDAFLLRPGAFVLVDTMEHLFIPNGYAVDLRLKSTMARMGLDHSMAFWFDPGWDGIGTMELKNRSQYDTIELRRGMRIAQIIVHQLDQLSLEPYKGRYQHAQTVQDAKLVGDD